MPFAVGPRALLENFAFFYAFNVFQENWDKKDSAGGEKVNKS